MEPYKDLTSLSDASWSGSSCNSCYLSEPDFPHLEKEDSNPRHRINWRLSQDGKGSANSGCGYIWPVFLLMAKLDPFSFFPWTLVNQQAFSLPVFCSNKNEAGKMENRAYTSSF